MIDIVYLMLFLFFMSTAVFLFLSAITLFDMADRIEQGEQDVEGN
jgi:hypothetical protein